MENKKHKILKISLIISLILNLSFTSGYVIKKYVSSPGSKEIPSEQGNNYCKHKPHKTGYRHLAHKNPEFENEFHKHRKHYKKVSNDLIKFKTELLNELKKEVINQDTVDRLLEEINRLNKELHDKNYLHLLSLKKLLDPKDFVALLDRMNEELCIHREMHYDTEENHFHEKKTNLKK
jgi:hypothetical protein